MSYFRGLPVNISHDAQRVDFGAHWFALGIIWVIAGRGCFKGGMGESHRGKFKNIFAGEDYAIGIVGKRIADGILDEKIGLVAENAYNLFVPAS